ncbi:archease [Candidatus Pacearchaeota archaeon]|nr:archease [Candidatus Pacearchaeota archaeon]
MRYKFLPHTADIKFQAYGKTLDESFENSALAMFNAMHKEKIKSKIKKTAKASGKDLESLLYNFLEQLLVLLDSKNFFLANAKVKINEKNLKLIAELWGDNAGDYSIGLDVKAITYNNIFVKKIKGKWVCQVVVDV